MLTSGDGDLMRTWYVNHKKYQKKSQGLARQRYLAMLYLKKCDRSRYGLLYHALQNQYSRGTPQYPHDLAAAYSMVVQHKADCTRNRGATRNQDDKANPSGLNFLQSGDPVPGTNGVLCPRTRCCRCQQLGHLKRVCPNGKADVSALQHSGPNT